MNKKKTLVDALPAQKSVVDIPYDFNVKDMDDLLNYFPIFLRNHSRRVAVCSSIMAGYVKEIRSQFKLPRGVEWDVILHLGGLCHDVGKLTIPILSTDKEEYRKHPAMGAQLLEQHKDVFFDNEEQAQMVLEIVRHHHERPDGKGFPDELRSKDIMLAAGICAVANDLDHRIYGKKDSPDRAFHDIKPLKGSHFCERSMFCLKRAWPQIREKYIEWNHFSM